MINGVNTTVFTNQANYNSLLNCYYQPWRNCLPSVNGTYYNSTAAFGFAANATNGSYPFGYYCTSFLPIAYQGQGAVKMTEALAAIFTVLSVLYVSAWDSNEKNHEFIKSYSKSNLKT